MLIALSNLLKWNRRSLDLQDSYDWLDLFDDFGPQLLRFLLSTEYNVDDIPEDDPLILELKKQIKDFPLTDFKPKHSSVWILFAFRENLSQLPDPFRKDGILLPFEWRTGEDITQHSLLLPEGLIDLADKVKQQFGEKAAKYYLYPDSIFQDRVDFSMDGIGFSSGWGALVSGLYLALNSKAMLLEWPFSSIQYDFEKGEMDAVGHLEEKITLAASFNAEEFAVAPCQYKEAVKALNIVKAKYPENKKIRKMKIFMVKSAGSIEKTAASIIKCNQHEKQRLIRNICLAHAAVLLFLGIITGILYWDHTRKYVEYYADYVDRWGIPEGIFPLEKDDLTERHAHYQFIYCGRKSLFGERVLREVMRSNSKGCFLEADDITKKFFDQPIRQKIEYKTKGNDNFVLDHIKIVNRNGKVLEQRNYSGKNMTCIDFTIIDGEGVKIGKMQNAVGFGISTGLMTQSKAEISRWRLSRDENGFLIKIRFCKNSFDIPAKNAEGIYGRSFKLDQYGRQIEASYLDHDGKKMQLKNGISSVRYDYQKNSDGLSGVSWNDIFGKSVKSYKFILDENQNFIERSFYLAGKPACEDGYFKAKRKYLHGNLIEVTLFGIDGKPCVNKFGLAKYTAKYDERGNAIEVIFLGIDGKPCMRREGIAKGTAKYDDRGNVIEEAYFGIDGKPCVDKDGIAKLIRKYDERGNLIESVNIGIDGKPCLDKYGIAKLTKKYDERGNLTESAYFGIDGKPCLHKDGNDQYTAKYDERGNLIESANIGIDGDPYLRKDGISKLKRKYDERGNLIEEAYFGIDGKPCLDKGGISKLKRKYDERGILIEEAYFDIDSKPCLHKNGIAKFIRKYDERGNLVEEAYFDIVGDPCLRKDGISKLKRKYDDRGNMTEESYFGIDGKPCLNKNGYAKFIRKYDERGNLVEVRSFGLHDKVLGGMKSLVVVTSVEPDSHAGKADIKRGDFILDFAGTDWRNGNVNISENLWKVRNIEKQIIFARKNHDGSFNVFPKTFPAGIIGLGMDHSRCSMEDYNRIMKVYHKFRGW